MDSQLIAPLAELEQIILLGLFFFSAIKGFEFGWRL